MYRKYLTKKFSIYSKQNFKEALNDTGYNFNNELKTANNGLLTPRSTTMTTPQPFETIEAI
jgi:hypothetical protein